MELAQQGEDLGIRFDDVMELRVFPQFVVVAGFDERVALVQVVLQRCFEDVAVFVELVGQASVASVRVAEDDDFGGRVDLDDLGVAVCPSEPRYGSHGLVPFRQPLRHRG